MTGFLWVPSWWSVNVKSRQPLTRGFEKGYPYLICGSTWACRPNLKDHRQNKDVIAKAG
jgi:hypothetical protein